MIVDFEYKFEITDGIKINLKNCGRKKKSNLDRVIFLHI